MRRALSLAILALLACAPGAGAADWRDGGIVTATDQIAQPVRPAVGGGGDAAFAWAGYFRSGSQPHVRTRPRGGTLGPDTLLSTDAEDIEAYANAEDDVLLTSAVPLGTPRRVVVRSGTVLNPTGSPQTLAATGSDFLCTLDAAIGPGGRAVVIYGVAPATPGASFADPDR